MKKEIIQKKTELYVVGLSVRTNNQECFNSQTNKIVPLIARYWQENIPEKIPHRKKPGTTLAESFCNRVKERKKLQNNIYNNINTVIVSFSHQYVNFFLKMN
jgi:hypothetical protein